MSEDSDIHTLHRYFIWANRLRNNLYQVGEEKGPPPAPGDHRAFKLWFTGPFMYSSYWFAALYVLIEGWKKLGLNDIKIDTLLKSEYCDLLRRYRNGVFHYQEDYFDRRFKEFYDEGDDIADWVNEVHEEFSRYFLEWFKSRGMDYTVRKLENGNIELVIETEL